MEVYNQPQFAQLDLPGAFVQLNHLRSRRGVVRGLHFQSDPPMGKLMRVTVGDAFLIAVDVRRDSATLGNRWDCTRARRTNFKSGRLPGSLAAFA
jgi:dTDP-4-dehydrorhamnose 3,5-epimerase